MCEPGSAPHQNPSISPDEWILRRIHINHYDPHRPIPIDAASFRPSPQDQDGLSFFRERLISAEQVARSARQPAENYIVARYRAGDLFDLGLTLTPTNDSDDPPGHVVVIELGNSGYNENKRLCKERHKRLAELGSRDVIKGFSGP